MQQSEMGYLHWMARFDTQVACLEAIVQHRWPIGFPCPKCGHDYAYVLNRGHKRQCARCRRQIGKYT